MRYRWQFWPNDAIATLLFTALTWAAIVAAAFTTLHCVAAASQSRASEDAARVGVAIGATVMEAQPR